MERETITPTRTPAPEPMYPVQSHPQPQQVISMSMDTVQGFEGLQRAAKMLSCSALVPKEYQGAAGIASCVIALNLAARIGADPLMVMQNLYIVHGRPGWGAQFLIATFNSCGRFTALRYEFVGKEGEDAWGCRAWAIEKATGERIEGAVVTIALARKEGWYQKPGSKWQTMPQQMLMYRSASWFIKAYAPELAMGLQTAEEIGDIIDVTDATVTEVQIPAGEPPVRSRRSRVEALKGNAVPKASEPTTHQAPELGASHIAFLKAAAEKQGIDSVYVDEAIAGLPMLDSVAREAFLDDVAAGNVESWEQWTPKVGGAA